jgi:hypothetical protein
MTDDAAPNLARRQAELVAALVAGAPVPPGFDDARVDAARRALLRKRAGEVARAWPMLAAGCGARWPAEFAGWAAGRAGRGAMRDGWDLARTWAAAGRLATPAAEELATREVIWRYDGEWVPLRRRWPALRRAPGVLLLQVAGRAVALRHRPPSGPALGR